MPLFKITQTIQMKSLLFLTGFLFLSGFAFAQTPFICEGDFYLILAPGGVSTAYEVEIDPNNGNVIFNPLSTGTTGVLLNSIGFRFSDNFIYGINTETNNLYQIDANGTATFITGLSLNPAYNYPSGDITPDGSTLVLVGNSGSGGINVSEELAFVNLESGNYEVVSIPLSGPNVLCFDIAIDPIDGEMYSFDALGARLVRLNATTGVISASFPATPASTSMGSLFFDAFGVLFGYGSGANSGPNNQNSLFRLDKLTGNVELEATGPNAQRSDGCSCPFTIELLKTVETPETVPCTEVQYTFEFANRSGIVQADVQFIDQFPVDFTIVDIQNPFGGTIVSGIGSNIIQIDGMLVPLGINELVVSVEIGQNAVGTYGNQASLNGLPEGLGMSVLSDNPFTIAKDDSTYIQINPLEIDFSTVATNICPGESIVLEPSIFGVNYEWSDGSTESTFTISEAGTYAVTVTSGCDVAIETITVTTEDLSVDLGPDLELFLGDSIQLMPDIFPTTNVSYQWESTTNMINCLTCPEPFTRPIENALYSLSIRDENDCTASDSLRIFVKKDTRFFIPNVFSPNDDGFNDGFYIQSPITQELKTFRIYSRWGEMIFEEKNIFTNDESRAWNGKYRGKAAMQGVYAYHAVVQYLDGTTLDLSGDVLLLR